MYSSRYVLARTDAAAILKYFESRFYDTFIGIAFKQFISSIVNFLPTLLNGPSFALAFCYHQQ
jgi:hypothetical protein